MLYSMTGFGKSVLQLPSKKITIEIKSLNSKNLDLNVRMPSMYREKELSVRKYLAQNLHRGKVDFALYIENTGTIANSQINQDVVRSYMQQLKEVANASEAELLQMALRLPDTVMTDRDDINEDEWQAIFDEVVQCVQQLKTYRKEEGVVLEKDFNNRREAILDLLDNVVELDPQRIDLVRERLTKAVNEIKEKYDANRFEQELIYYLEKYDITEEKVRLKNHLNYFGENLKSNDSNGKKLGFICQEIGREINTIGSKANYAPMQKIVVQMKDELEKVKEQLLNIL